MTPLSEARPRRTMDYRDTLNLPTTAFPMRAALSQREPDIAARWEQMGVYERMLEARKNGPLFLLHDGPPYANGNIHIGHALNKILKDIVVKFRSMTGCLTPYRPGWDCHGLPIELEVEKRVGSARKAESTVAKVRQECDAYAERFVAVQREEFRRLGVFGQWASPYLTKDFAYEAQEIRELAKIVARGGFYRGRKPVHWCASCRTALAEAEVDYADRQSLSVYVAFPATRLAPALERHAQRRPEIAIWTTTPWTLPANLAIAVHPELEYALVTSGPRSLVVARPLVDGLREKLGLGDVVATFPGKDLEGTVARHPWLDRDSPVVLGEHVTLDAGTGCVHTAPGHGHDDHVIGQRYGLETYVPVDAAGRFTAQVPEFQGRRVFDSDEPIVDLLEQRGALLAREELTHSYPHCWRCKNPVIFRATEQWFLSMEHDDLRRRALTEIDRVEWVPRWGRDRIRGMIESRPDWCLSRQRAWGVPVVAVRCAPCGRSLTDERLLAQVAEIFQQEGSDSWYSRDLSTLVPAGLRCPDCGGAQFERETDVLDVWFDSGVSFAAVVESEHGSSAVADLYLEGSDQHRGWFHSALLAAVATRGRAPYRAVLTHGFVLDGEGRKMSKSVGNVVAPQRIIQDYGADILRLWVAAEDYRDDVRISEEIMRRLADSYRRVRNTARNLLGNLADFDPATDRVALSDMPELDRWTLGRLEGLIRRCRAAYAAYEFHLVYHALNNFCSADLSALYFDIVKDRLYCSARASRERRAVQTVMHDVLLGLVRVIAPILSFTAEEIWQAVPYGARAPSVFLSDFPDSVSAWRDDALMERWERILGIRTEVTRALEADRKRGSIGHSLDARVRVSAGARDAALLAGLGSAELARIWIVSQVELVTAHEDGLAVEVFAPLGSKCGRCWNYATTVGSHADHSELCDRCHAVVIAR